MTIVDIHCHTFNADDLPVQGFVERVAGRRKKLASVLAIAADRVSQSMADNADKDHEVLDRLLREPVDEHETTAVTTSSNESLEHLITELEQDARDDLLAAQDEVTASEPVLDIEEEGVVDLFRDVKRYIRWVGLFGKSRLDLTTEMIRVYNDVELFTPLLVDFRGLQDEPKTPLTEQFSLQEKVSRLSMRGDLGAAVHPFVPFDPRRRGGVRLAQRGVLDFGGVGVKMYPPMGFLPIGNAERSPLDMDDPPAVDRALRELYEWCEAEHVPITAHCNPSNYAHATYEDYSHPENWRRVLNEFPELHLNLGHFGWGGRGSGWPAAISEMSTQFEYLFADIGNHHVEAIPETFDALQELFDRANTATASMSQRLMFGTDWFMVASHRRFEQFLVEFQAECRRRLPAMEDMFMGGAALRFLGFDKADNSNNRRLRARYSANGNTTPGWLVGEA